MEKICCRYGLLSSDGGLVRIPFLAKGRLVVPPAISRQTAEDAFSSAGKDAVWVKSGNVQILREPVIERLTMRPTGEYIYQVMPGLNPGELVEKDFEKLAAELYQLQVSDVLSYIERITETLKKNIHFLTGAVELMRRTSEYPDCFLDNWLTSASFSLDSSSARQMIDSELAYRGLPGSRYLDGWVEVPAKTDNGWLTRQAQNMFPAGRFGMPQKPYVRAMPVRQLHITAGNAPDVPLISTLRAVLTKSAAVIKLPYGAVIPGILIALAAVAAAPRHPITRNLSMVYWQGGDEEIEGEFFRPGAFDRIVVWGSPRAVASVQSRVPFTRTICLNPRYGISLIGGQARPGNLEEAAARASLDVMIYNQKACTASLVHYFEGTRQQACEYARILSETLKKWDEAIPNFVPPEASGRVKRMRRGRYAGANWYANNAGGGFSSGVVVVPGEFDILDHPMCRMVVVKPVARLEDALGDINQFVSTAGVYPEGRRIELLEKIASRGVSSVLPLGQCERVYPGMPHDGMLVLGQLVEWKTC
ncbi:MAG: hypothetical protein JW954_07535 [Dehalococcoidaceae bacterium]|nr:hypothetical protein [Dehalococcoidaceae bacterium]